MQSPQQPSTPTNFPGQSQPMVSSAASVGRSC